MSPKQKLLELSSLLVKLVAIWTALCAAAPAANKRTAADIPKGPLSSGNCRLIINELNLYPAGQQQFIELKRSCRIKPQKVFNVKMEVTEDKLQKSAYKIVVIDHRGYLVAVCHLTGEARTRYGDNIFYVLGGTSHSNRDFKIEDCEIAENYEDSVGKSFLPIGDVAPIAIGLVHNNAPKVIRAVALDETNGKKLKVRIDYELQRRLVENLQDLIVFASSAPHSECEFFKELYSRYTYEQSGYFIVRDWADETVATLSQSRCSSQEEAAAWLPFQHQYFSYAFASPNSPNNCEKTLQFIVENEQPKRSTPRQDFIEDSKGCSVLTEDEAIEEFETITNHKSYNNRLLATFKNEIIGVETHFLDPAGLADPFNTECESEQAPFPYNPSTSQEFEAALEDHKQSKDMYVLDSFKICM